MSKISATNCKTNQGIGTRRSSNFCPASSERTDKIESVKFSARLSSGVMDCHRPISRAGYSDIIVEAIIQGAGGTKTNIYTHFGGKEGLFRAIIESLRQELLEPLSRLDSANLISQEVLLTVFGL